MTPRARPLSPDERRAQIIDVTLPLLLAHGRTVTTKQIAEAAGVAEGTLFRVFESKHELVMAAIEHALDFEPFLADLARIDRNQPLRARLLDIVTHFQIRFRTVFEVMTAMGMQGPPKSHQHMAEQRDRAAAVLVDLVAPDADSLTCAPGQLVHILRLLTFSGTHPHISDGVVLTPEQIVDTVLHGVLVPTPSKGDS